MCPEANVILDIRKIESDLGYLRNLYSLVDITTSSQCFFYFFGEVTDPFENYENTRKYLYVYTFKIFHFIDQVFSRLIADLRHHQDDPRG